MKKLNKNWIILPYNSISKTTYNNFFKSPRIGFFKSNSKKLNYRSYIMNSIYSLKMVLLNFQNYAVIMFLWRQIVICFMDFSAIRIYVISLTIFCSDLSTVKSLFRIFLTAGRLHLEFVVALYFLWSFAWILFLRIMHFICLWLLGYWLLVYFMGYFSAVISAIGCFMNLDALFYKRFIFHIVQTFGVFPLCIRNAF